MSTDTITAYRASVERHLAALLDEIRDDLTAGLRAHLADVAADLRPGETLEHRLGSPAQCASSVLGYCSSLAHLEVEYARDPAAGDGRAVELPSMSNAPLAPAVLRRAAP